MKRIGVIGAGGWGTALALLAYRHGHRAILWARRPDFAEALRRDRENRNYLPGVALPEAIEIASDPVALSGQDIVFLAVPTRYIQSVLARIQPALGADTPVVSCAKGIDPTSLKRASELTDVALQPLSPPLFILSGPTHAEDVGHRLAAAAVLAGGDATAADNIAGLLSGTDFRVETSADMIGVELAGALKNVVALACGISDGLGRGDSARAALATQGFGEIARLGAALGARPATFFGLAGFGDLVATISSPHSRHRRAGIRLASGLPATAVEGVPTACAALRLGQRLGIDLPLIAGLCAILFGGQAPASLPAFA